MTKVSAARMLKLSAARRLVDVSGARVQPVSGRVGERSPLIIVRVDVTAVALPLRQPIKMASETITHARNIVVRIEAADGTVGWGEAASAPTMTGDTQGGLVAAVRDHLAPRLLGRDAWDRPASVAILRAALVGNTGAHSAIEMALFDLAGRKAGLPVVDLIGRAVRRAVVPMWLLGRDTLEEDVAEAVAKVSEGFRFFKLKVATKELDQDIATVRALRAVLGTEMALCADANCGFSREAARHFVEAARDSGLLFLEQPLAAADLAGLETLARISPIPIGADEGIHALHDIEAHAQHGAGGVSLKLIKLGGFSAALEAAALCEQLELEINVAAKVAESSIASAAAIHLACALPRVAWGVSLTHVYLAEDLVRSPPPLRDGMIAVPDGTGLGVEVDEGQIARFRVA
jgi:muconate cycloisomerase